MRHCLSPFTLCRRLGFQDTIECHDVEQRRHPCVYPRHQPEGQANEPPESAEEWMFSPAFMHCCQARCWGGDNVGQAAVPLDSATYPLGARHC